MRVFRTSAMKQIGIILADVPRLGGLSKEFASLKEMILFSLADKDVSLRYKGDPIYFISIYMEVELKRLSF